MSIMRIAIAGTGGLARLIATQINEATSHHVVLLSRKPQTNLAASGFQIAVVDYTDIETLKYALRGIDTVISTLNGPGQIEVIKAAVAVRVRRFAPAEFSGPPTATPTPSPVEHNQAAARQWLTYYAQHLQSTIFVCGILYERFQPGGLAHSRLGTSTGLAPEAAYMLDIRNMHALAPIWDAADSPTATLCLTAAPDVARFVTRALDLPHWPPELRMSGLRITVRDLVALVQRLRGKPFNPLTYTTPALLTADLQLALAQQDVPRTLRAHALLATAEGRYDFVEPNLNAAFPDVRPMGFAEWFLGVWGRP